MAIPVLAYPLSGANEPREFLGALGSLGEALAPGAATTLNKLLVHFPDAALWQPLLVLLAWSVLGIALIAVGQLRDQQEQANPAAGEFAAGEGVEGNENAELVESGAAPHGAAQANADEGFNPAEGTTTTERG